jgi:hypothetical protein
LTQKRSKQAALVDYMEPAEPMKGAEAVLQAT